MNETVQNTGTPKGYVPIAEYKALEQEVIYLKQQIAELQRLIHGSKSERFVSTVDDTQLDLFSSKSPEPENTPVAQETVLYTRKKKKENPKKPVRSKLPTHLPRETEIIDPDKLEDDARKIGEEITELLEYTPGKLYVREIIRPKYVSTKKEGVSIADLPSLPIPKANAGASF